MRIAFALCLALLAFAGPARAQTDAQFYIGTWRDVPTERPAARRAVLHHIEITQIATLRAPRRFNVRIWLRCQDRAEEACELGSAEGVERSLGSESAIYVEMNPRLRATLRPCRFNLLMAPAYYPDAPGTKARLDYRTSPPGGPCADSELSGITDTFGTLERMPVLNQPIEPNRPTLPRPRF
jgi:hypothetical protein